MQAFNVQGNIPLAAHIKLLVRSIPVVGFVACMVFLYLGGIFKNYLLLKQRKVSWVLKQRDQIRMEMEPEEERQEFVPSSSTGKTEGGGNSGSSSAAAAKRRKLQQQQQQQQQKVLLDDEQRCKRSDGKGWRCEHMRAEGSTYCDHHYYRKNKTPSKTKKVKNKSFSPRKLFLAANSSRLFSAAKSDDDEEEEDDRTGGEVLSGMVEDEIGSRMCHQCQRNDKAKVIYCSRCNCKRYCSPCIRAWYPLLSEKDVAAGCPFCNGNCNCKACLLTYGSQREETMRQDDDMTQGFLKYLLLKLLPCLKQLHNEQRDELKVERSLQRTPHVEIEKAAISVDESLHCNNCSTFIVDYHRGCPSCEYQLCLTCCQELRLGCGSGERGGGRREGHQEVVKQQQQDGKEEAELVEIPGSMNLEKPVGESAAASAAAAWAASADGSIRCPPVSRGGCGQCQLSLKTLFEHNWIAKLTMDAEMESYNAQTEQDASRCSICDLCGGDVKKKFLRLAAHRKGENDNYLYCPSRQNIEDVEDKDSGGLAHFQKHWVQGEPIIVCNVLEAGGGHGLSWEPMVVWRAVRETTKKKLERKTVAAIDCLNWQEVDVKLHQFFMGYKKGRSHKDGWPQLLKLKDWPSSIQFEERLPRHTAEFLAALPFQQYTNPKTGFHNLAAQLPENIIKPNLGPKMYIANGLKEELLKGDSVIKLHKDIADIVYVLMHTAEVELLEEQQEVIKKWMQNSKRSSDSKSSFGVKYDIDRPHTRKSIYGGALWDIFRRQDTPKLEAYLRKHWEEFNIPGHWVVESVMHPIHDQAFFLTSDHKRKLKDEYGIEAWTFEQNEGEAVLIPAGCPYQVRNLKSCIHVALEFVSPESLQECLHLTNELRCLPKYHHANEDKLEVKKMLVYGATKVVHSLQQIRDGYD